MNIIKEEMVHIFGKEECVGYIEIGHINENMVIEIVNRDALSALSVNQM